MNITVRSLDALAGVAVAVSAPGTATLCLIGTLFATRGRRD